jgi:hypothetical protein
MQQHGLTIRNLEGKGRNERPTLMRFFQYVFNNNLTIVGAPNTDILQIPWFDEDLQNIIRCLGFEWTRYFNIETYRGAFDRMSFKKMVKFERRQKSDIFTDRCRF